MRQLNIELDIERDYFDHYFTLWIDETNMLQGTVRAFYRRLDKGLKSALQDCQELNNRLTLQDIIWLKNELNYMGY